MERNLRPLDIVTNRRSTTPCARHGHGRLHQHRVAHAGAGAVGRHGLRPGPDQRAFPDTTPNICKVSPSRPDVHIEDVHRAGGIGAILKEIARYGSRRSTWTRRRWPALCGLRGTPPAPDGDVIRPAENAFSETGGLAVLFGNLAPKGAVVKTAGVDAGMMQFEGRRAFTNPRKTRWRAFWPVK